jgi:hypothetical protein
VAAPLPDILTIVYGSLLDSDRDCSSTSDSGHPANQASVHLTSPRLA